ncbi:MAG: phosphatase PAP2 family protein [Candidatus Jorgensenbacteria bacterium]|nr:phosphatase PAP2 family protein [Candidatus Jorgensenbacteria bacterium]
MDNAIFNILHSWAGVSVIGDWFGIVLAAYLPWGLAIAVLVLLAKDPSRVKKLEHFIFIALSLLVARGFLTELIRYFVERDRPFVTLGFEPLIEQSVTYAFPSGHAAIFFALALAVWFLNKNWGWWFGGLALVNGIARVVAGVHWPTDILAGAAVGVLAVLAVHWILKKIPRTAKVSAN